MRDLSLSGQVEGASILRKAGIFSVLRSLTKNGRLRVFQHRGSQVLVRGHPAEEARARAMVGRVPGPQQVAELHEGLRLRTRMNNSE